MKKLFPILIKFLGASIIATGIDFICFYFLKDYLTIFYAEITAGFVGMTVNFILQKKYVFNLKRNMFGAFALSILFSVAGVFLGGFLISYLLTFSLFANHVILAKIVSTGVKFFYNFFTKRWIFEKSLLGKNQQ